MSGAKQHFIPQFLLREFSLVETRLAKIKRVWVFPKGRDHFATATEGVGAQKYFYSTISTTDETTLDDIITDYEGQIRITHKYLLGKPDAPGADACSEFVGHLVVRNAHLRSALAHGFESLMEAAVALLGTEEALVRAFGLDRASPTPRFKEAFGKFLDENPLVAATLNLDALQIERLAFIAAKENFSDFASPFLGALHQGLSIFLGSMSAEIRNQHNKLLTATLLPTGLYREIMGFQWKVVDASDTLILPDCVAVGYETDGEHHPLMLCRSERLSGLICPISSRLALIGARKEQLPSLMSFNKAAAECSHEFFVTSEASDSFCEFAALISKRAHIQIDSAVDLATARLDDGQAGPDKEIEYTPGFAADKSAFSGDISIRMRDFGDEDLARRLGQPLLALVVELANDLPLGLIDGFTFAIDYDAALAELDRGVPDLSPLKSFDEWYGKGAIMAPVVVRDDRAKVHIVGTAALAMGLLSDQEDQRLLSISAIAYALAHAAHVAILDEAAPKIWFGRILNEYDRTRFDMLEQAYSGYFSSRIVARILNSDREAGLDLLENCLDSSRSLVLNALKSHYAEPDFGLLYARTSAVTHNIMMFTSRVIGHNHGNQLDLESDRRLMDLMKRYTLDRWVIRFGLDLAALWNTQGQRTGLGMFSAMLDHFDRVMLACGVFVWSGEQGIMIYPQKMSASG